MIVKDEHLSENQQNKKIMDVSLKIISNTDINPRKSGINMENVEKLVEAQDFPEIHLGFYNGELIVVDGYHRLAATRQMEKDTIKAFIMKYEDINELKKAAFTANVNHGLKLSDYDIAMNIYEFYIERIKKVPSGTLSSIIKEYNVPDRVGRTLFWWTVINKEILCNGDVDLSTKGKCEELSWLITQSKEQPGEISELFKQEFKEFFNKYGISLKREQLREAMRLHIQGKDYNEETARQAEVVEGMEAADRKAKEESVEKIENEDLIDRTGNADYSNNMPKNEKMEELASRAELNEKAKEISKGNNEAPKFVSVTNTIDNMAESIMMISLMKEKGKAEISEEDYKKLLEINKAMSELINSVKSEKEYGDIQ